MSDLDMALPTRPDIGRHPEPEIYTTKPEVLDVGRCRAVLAVPYLYSGSQICGGNRWNLVAIILFPFRSNFHFRFRGVILSFGCLPRLGMLEPCP
jgi:hypothetical protein